MTLLLDTFWDHVPQLQSEGWVLTDMSRYDPTRIVGITPTGKAFTATLVDNLVTVTVAGRERTTTRDRAVWEPGDATVAAFRETYEKLPVSQR